MSLFVRTSNTEEKRFWVFFHLGLPGLLPPQCLGSHRLGPHSALLPQMSSGMSQLIGLKEKGLPQIARLLQSGNSDVVRSGASLLSNMSRHPVLHCAMGKHPPQHLVSPLPGATS